MSVAVLATLYAIGIGTGWLIGAIGVGGVLLVPALVIVGGMGVEAATPVASLSFLFTGLAGTVAYAMRRRLSWRVVGWLTAGAVPGAIAGAATNVSLSPRLITIAIAVVLAAAAVRTVWSPPASGGTSLGSATQVGIGGVVGFASALTGTGGPVLLIPAVMLLGGSALTAVAAGQPIQVPIALAATIGFLVLGDVDWPLAVGLGATQAAGTVAGARFSARAPVETLRRLVSFALVASTAVFIFKAASA